MAPCDGGFLVRGCRQHRDRLDLQHCTFAREAGDRNGGAGRPVRICQIAIPHLTENLQVLDIGEIIIELHNVLKLRAYRGERGFEILESLHRL